MKKFNQLFSFYFLKLLFTLVATCSLVDLQAKEIKAVIICDTQAANISDSVKADLAILEKFIAKLSENTGVKVSKQIYTANDFDEEIKNSLSSIQISSDDTVFFYFSGHGYRTPGKGNNQWPNLFLTPLKKGLDFKEIINILQKNEPRLLIALCDCCNNIIPDAYAPPLIESQIYRGVKLANLKKRYIKLFLETKGTLIISSAMPGEYSWGSNIGGIYTNAFFNSLYKEIKNHTPTDWHVILSMTGNNVAKQDLGQTPLIEQDLK